MEAKGKSIVARGNSKGKSPESESGWVFKNNSVARAEGLRRIMGNEVTKQAGVRSPAVLQAMVRTLTFPLNQMESQ